jgi:hypothetical protein
VTEDLLAAFETCAIRNEDFHHGEHVHVAFLYLCSLAPLEAMQRFSEGLRNFASRNGKPERYHETITWAFLVLIRERITRALLQNGHYPTWDEFAARNPDLLNWKDNVLKKYYSDELLASDLARTTFLLPDRIVQP